MKKRKPSLLLLSLLAILFTGCFETTEEITIADNGSGTYHVNMNMDALFSMLDAMKGMDSTGQADSMFSKKMDTTVHFNTITDTAKALSASEKSLLKNATLHMLMSQADQKFQINMDFPFTRIDDVQKIMALGRSKAVARALGNAFKKEGNGMGDENNGQLPDLNSFYDVTIKKGLVQRTVNKKKLDSLLQDGQMKGLLESGNSEMMESIKLNTVIHLPKPVKKWTGDKVQLSDDKKTITIPATLPDLMQHPQALAYRIEY